MRVRILLAVLALLGPVQARDYRFDGEMSEEVLRSYLSRSMTLMYLLTGGGDLDDNIRMMKETGVKFAGRAVHNWGREQGGESALPKRLEEARAKAAKIHAADPEIILQACIFEIVSDEINKLAVPAWAFEALGMPVETRNFRLDDIKYVSGKGIDQWGKATCIPDVSRPETKLWFHYLAASYIDIGCEAIHFGQTEIMNSNDPGNGHWSEVLERTRAHAKQKARRHFVLLDSHVPNGGLVREGKLLFDFHSFPLRVEEVPEKPREGRLRIGYKDAIYGRSKGGVTPSGWKCEHLPYLVELDNYGRSKKPGEAGMGVHWVWGWDEITWFSQQPAAYRNEWLGYAWKWVRENDSAGYLQMPGMRCLAGAADKKNWYWVNRPSPATPGGSGQEDAIREIWEKDTGK
ncbi:hypothetical protein [Luteolibacter sp. Populi]|uniref:hypothetical protein n=1 Tax=Luteolibacter sp. Populi TaxID=3230487 RepID=UPI0034654F4A